MANETMVSPSQSTSSSSKTSERSLKLKKIREIKNSVIGNRYKKYCNLHCIPELHSILSSSNDVELQVQAIAAIGSLAYGIEDGARAVVECNGISSLVHALTHNDQRVVVAAARSLKLVLQSSSAPRDPVLQPPVLHRIVELVRQSSYVHVNDIAAGLLRLCCTDEAQASLIVSAGAVPALVQLLMSASDSSQEAAVEALATITHFSKDACQQLLLEPTYTATCSQQKTSAAACSWGSQASLQQTQQQQYPPVLQQLLHLTRQHTGKVRYLCISCISSIGRHIRDVDEAVQLQVANVCRCVLPYVARLLVAADSAAAAAAPGDRSAAMGCTTSGKGQDRYLYHVPLVLSALVHDQPELLKLAVEVDTIQSLIKLLHSKAASAASAAPKESEHAAVCQPASSAATTTVYKSAVAAAKAARLAAAAMAAAAAVEDAATLRKGCLMSLAAIAMQGDEARQKMMEGGRMMSAVVPSLSDSVVSIRVAAAECLRGLSKSVKLLRCGSIPDTVAAPLVAMLQDSQSSDVQVAAAAAVCNLVLGFSSVRSSLIKSGVIAALVPLFSSMDTELRMQAVWAYKNLAVECSTAVRGSLLSELTWQQFMELLTAENDARVQQQAYGLLQNLLCSGGDSIDQVLKWSNDGLLSFLADRLESAKYRQLVSAEAPTPEEITAQYVKNQLTSVLYAVNNVCSGTEAHKAAVMATRIPLLLLQYLRRSASCSATPMSVAGVEYCRKHNPAVLCLDVHLAAVWCVINLLWSDKVAEGTSTGGDASASASDAAVVARAAALRRLGYEDVLKDVLEHSTCAASSQAAAGVGVGGRADTSGELRGCAGSQDLMERIQTALEKLRTR